MVSLRAALPFSGANPMDLLAASAAFLRLCRTGRDLSANTIKAYTQDLGDLRRYLADDAHVSPATASGLTAHAEWLIGPRGLAPATVKRRLDCLRALFAWVERRGDNTASPFRTAEVRIRLPKRLPRCLTAVELRHLFAGRRQASVPIALAVLLLFTTGLRVVAIMDLQ